MTRHLRTLAAGLSVLVLAVFWLLYFLNARLQRDLQSAISQFPQPPTVNGFLFRPDGLKRLPAHLQNVSTHPPAQTVVFVLSDECAPCVRQAPAWIELIARLPREGSALLFASFVGERLVSQLAAVARNRGLPFDSYAIEHRQAFSRSSGVGSTPKLLLLDAEQRLRFVATGFGEAVELDLLATVDTLGSPLRR